MAQLTFFGGSPLFHQAPSVGKTVKANVTSQTDMGNGIVITHGTFSIPSGDSISEHTIHKLVLDDGKTGTIFVVHVSKSEAIFCGTFS